MTIIMDELEQGGKEWILARIGCITMSNAGKLLTGGEGKTRRSYIVDVASEVLSGLPAVSIETPAMARGTFLEIYARRAYEAVTGIEVRQVGLAYLDISRRISASPDGLAGITSNGGLEIKCRAPKAHLATILHSSGTNQLDPATIAQIQGCMWVFGVASWDFCSFCPEFESQPLYILTVQRDEQMIERIAASAHNAVREVDEIINGIRGATQKESVATICAEAVEALAIENEIYEEIY